MGYRYFETIPGAAQTVCYPFGYGLSYTEFSYGDLECKQLSDGFTAKATVTNTGACAGKQVMQVYCQAPQGKLGKPYRVLVGFMKTRKLAPGESQRVAIHFNMYDFASYDDWGKVQASAWVLEAGEYRFLIGENVRIAQALPLVWTLEKDKVLFQLTPKCVPSQLGNRMKADGSLESFAQASGFQRVTLRTMLFYLSMDRTPAINHSRNRSPDGETKQFHSWSTFIRERLRWIISWTY